MRVISDSRCTNKPPCRVKNSSAWWPGPAERDRAERSVPHAEAFEIDARKQRAEAAHADLDAGQQELSFGEGEPSAPERVIQIQTRC